MKVHECVSFMLVVEGMVLLEKRSELKKTDPGLTAIPGGHIEAGENQEQALFRELKEELGVLPEEYSFLCSLFHPTNELQLIHYYLISSWQGDLQTLEADEIDWYRFDSAPLGIGADKIALTEYRRVSNFFR